MSVSNEITRFWTHGCGVMPQSSELTLRSRGITVVRKGFYTEVMCTQGHGNDAPGIEEWFHFAIPTPSKLEDQGMKVKNVVFDVEFDHSTDHGDVLANADFREITVCLGRERFSLFQAPAGKSEPSAQPKNRVPLPFSHNASGALSLSLLIHWHRPGLVRFVQAGAEFRD